MTAPLRIPAWHKDTAWIAGQCHHLPSVKQQTHIKRSYNKYIMGQESVQPARKDGRLAEREWGLRFFFFFFTMLVLLFIKRMRFPGCRARCWLESRSCFIHSLPQTHTNTHTATESVSATIRLSRRSSFLHGERLLQQFRCLKWGNTMRLERTFAKSA